MHQIARELPELDASFTPYYSDHPLMRLGRRLYLQESTIAGNKLRERCLDYLRRHGLAIDEDGQAGAYELVVTCTDQIMPRNIRDKPVVVVQEGILDVPNRFTPLCRRWPWIPRWIGGTAMTALSGHYELFCAASHGYRDDFIRAGADPSRVVVTGIPNFDDCARYRENDFPYRDYVLVCTSDMRETLKRDDRIGFLRRAVRIAQGRQLIFKLHPGEWVGRATREIARVAPRAKIFSSGSAEEMVANCEVLITQWSSLVFVGMALGKEVHSYFDLREVRRLLPLQNGCAARNIAEVCLQVFERRWGFRPGGPKKRREAAQDAHASPELIPPAPRARRVESGRARRRVLAQAPA